MYGSSQELLRCETHTAITFYREVAKHADPAIRAENFVAVMEMLQAAATKKFGPAERALGQIYLEGLAIPRNDVASTQFFMLAAKHGDPEGQLQTGNAMVVGRGTAKNSSGAAVWYRKAAGANMPQAALNLGILYSKGEGVPQSVEDAVK